MVKKMATCLIIPVGMSREITENIMSAEIVGNAKYIVIVGISGYEKENKEMVEGLRVLAKMVGAEFHTIAITPNNIEDVTGLYKFLKKLAVNEIVLVGTIGSRYLFPILLMVLLKLWKERKTKIFMFHGVEGEKPSLVPLTGFIAPALKITRMQKKVLDIVYSSDEPISGKDLIEKYGFKMVVYYVLATLERNGLVRVRRGNIEKTFAGELFYHFMKGD